MSNIQRLEELLKDEVLVEIEDSIDEIFELIASNQASDEDKEELEDLKELHLGFKEMLDELQAGEIDEDEALEIINDILEMMNEEDEED